MEFERVLNTGVLKCHKYFEVILGVDITLLSYNFYLS